MSGGRSAPWLVVLALFLALTGQSCCSSPLPRWQAASEGIPAQVGIAAVAVAPGDPQVLYLAAYEPGGLYRSADAGQSWAVANTGLEQTTVYGLAVAPNDANVVYAAALDGGYRTTNGGKSWQRVPGLPEVRLYGVAKSSDGQRVCAGGEGSGIWCSGDGGDTWEISKSATRQSPSQQDTVLCLAVDQDGRWYAGTAGQGVWASHDGLVWRPTPGQPASAHVTALAVAGDGRPYALAGGDLYTSDDQGETWRTAGPMDFHALSLAVEQGSKGRIYLGSGGAGLAVSEDGGTTWTRLGTEFRHADVTCLIASPGTPGTAYLACFRHLRSNQVKYK